MTATVHRTSADQVVVLEIDNPPVNAMNGAGQVVAPTGGRVSRYHKKKYKVFHRLHDDFLAYRRAMSG